MYNKLRIPKKIKVGFQERSDTYTEKLGFVTWIDDKGEVRQYTSWDGWRDEKIDPLDVENEPTEGFVLNKDVGGAKRSYGWNARNEYIRVYDPRGFEFEITVGNLLFILQECSSFKGKGLEGEFIYAWDKQKVILLPVETEEYRTSSEFSGLQSKRVTKADMKAGRIYMTKDQEKVIYLGRHDWVQPFNIYEDTFFKGQKKHIFIKEDKIDLDINDCGRYNITGGFTKLATCLDENPVDNIEDLLDDFKSCKFNVKPVKIHVRSYLKREKDRYFWVVLEGGWGYCYEWQYSNGEMTCYGVLSDHDGISWKQQHRYIKNHNLEKVDLTVELANGGLIKMGDY